MQFEGITLVAVVAELQEKIRKSLIQQIYQPLPHLIILQLYSREKYQLLISASSEARLHLTQQKYENPPAPPAFCMLLRKHLKGGKLEEISQWGLERMVDLKISHQGEEFTLRAELMGRHSNVILLKGAEILGALKPAMAPRKLVAHARYEPPPSQGKLDSRAISPEEFVQAVEAKPEEGVKSALLRVIDGIGPRTAGEIIAIAGLTPNKLVSELNAAERNALWQHVQKIFSRLEGASLQPCVYLQDGRPVDCTPFPFESYAHLECQLHQSLSEALDACFLQRHQEPFEQLARKLAKHLQDRLQKTERVLSQVKHDLEQAERYGEYKERGDLLMANLARIQKGQREIEVEDFLLGGRRVIPLDPALDPVSNAKRCYERYKKLKRAIEKLTERQQNLEMERSYLQDLSVALEQAETLEELWELKSELELQGSRAPATKKTRSLLTSGPRRYSIDGFSILIGRNGRQNDALIRGAHGEDYWLHAQDRPGAHVIIITGDRRGAVPPERVLLRAAELAAYYSRGRGSTKVPVSYTRVKYLKKPKGARPGAVLVTRQEGTLIVTPKEEE